MMARSHSSFNCDHRAIRIKFSWIIVNLYKILRGVLLPGALNQALWNLRRDTGKIIFLIFSHFEKNLVQIITNYYYNYYNPISNTTPFHFVFNTNRFHTITTYLCRIYNLFWTMGTLLHFHKGLSLHYKIFKIFFKMF